MYFSNHGLRFSTDPDPKKSQAKCIAWLQKPRELLPLTLCGNLLLWVAKIVQLGMTVTNKSIILEDNMNIKKAQSFLRNIELNQEFHFFSPGTKMTINQVHNSSWYGSVLYNIYGTEAVKLESCCSRSIKNMMDLPFGTHLGLIEPLSERQHLRKTFTRRFIDMIERKKV